MDLPAIVSIFVMSLAGIFLIVFVALHFGQKTERKKKLPLPLSERFPDSSPPFSNAIRYWECVSPSARIPLGHMNYDDALAKAMKLGAVGYVDFEYGFIFINLPGHSGEPPPGAPGIS